MAFKNPPVGGTELVRDAIQSRGFVTGLSGWSINRDGTAEFADVSIVLVPGGPFSSFSLEQLMWKLLYESSIRSNSFTKLPASVSTDTSGAPATILQYFPTVAPDNLAECNCTWTVTLALDIRPNAASAPNIFAELEIQVNGSAWVEQEGRIAVRETTALNRQQPYMQWSMPFVNVTDTFGFRIRAFQNADPATYTIQSLSTNLSVEVDVLLGSP